MIKTTPFKMVFIIRDNMYCPNCGTLCGESDHFCSNCGHPVNAPKLPKKGSLLVPVMIMILLCGFGIGLFFALPMGSSQNTLSGLSDHNGCFSVMNGVLYFEEASYSGGSELVVPKTVNGEQVLALADGCFKNCTSLTSVVLPETLESIGAEAFRGCSALRGIQIPDSVEQIGAKAFYGCSALDAVALSDSLLSIGAGAFGECNSLYYIMFSGKHADWVSLYDEFITPYTGVFCDDGSFYQGKGAE